MLHVGIVAGESSGDQLGAALIAELRARSDGIRVSAMAGPRMIAAGCDVVARSEELSVMGLVEVLRQYPRLRRLQRRVSDAFLAMRPDVFVGIDVPDFVLPIERRLHRAGIRCVHYVAPQIWAWRPSRAKKLKENLDLLLALFPFEEGFFRGYGVATECVGHPLADAIPLERDVAAMRATLGLERDARYVALMPGSRRQELKRHGRLFLDAAAELARDDRRLRFVAGVLDDDAANHVRVLAREMRPPVALEIVVGNAQAVLGACDVALLASGTITIEAMCAKIPAVVAYRLAGLSFSLMRRMVTVPYIAMPNVLSGRRLMPEFIQDDATPHALAASLRGWLEAGDDVQDYTDACMALHRSLRRNAAARAAEKVLDLAEAGARG